MSEALWSIQTNCEAPSCLPETLVLFQHICGGKKLFDVHDLILQVLEACVESGALRGGHGHTESESTAHVPAIARLQAEDASSVDSRASSGFGGVQFWDALRQVTFI